MPNIGPMEIALVLIVALLILGPKKLPDMGRSLGKSMREFKGAISGDSRDEDSNEKAPRLTAATDGELKAEERERETERTPAAV
jgi:sec-independent protein translocase protein TatA